MLRLRLINVVLAILIIMIPFTCLWGATIQVDGYGLSEDEARTNARNELAATIQTRVASKQTVLVSEYADGKDSKKEELFFDDTRVTVSIELFGVEFSQPRTMSDRRIHITASLTEKSIPQYNNKLALIKQNIESIENRNRTEENLLSRKQNLLLLMSYYEDFESYALIVTALDPDFEPPQLTNVKAGVQLDLMMLLEQERIELQNELTGITPSLTSEAMQQQAQIRLAAIRQQITENQQEASLLQATYEQQQKDLLELADLKIKNSIETMSQSAHATMKSLSQKSVSVDPQAMIQKIEEQKQAYTAIKKDLETEYKHQAAVIEEQYRKRVSDVRDKEYRTGEKVGGLPTEEAQAKRQKEIDGLYKEECAELQRYRAKLESSVQPQLNTLENQILFDYKNLDATEFTLQSIQDEIQFKIGNYDGYRKSWPVAVRFNVMDTQLGFDVYIPYEKITGKILPNFKSDSEGDQRAYDEYLDQVDLFETFLLTTKDPIFIEVKYKVSPSDAASEYYVIPEQLQFQRADTGKQIYQIPTSKLYQNISVHAFKPSTYMDLTYNSYYSKQIIATEAKKTKQKIKATNKNIMMNDRHLYYREGVYIGMGLISLPMIFASVNESSVGISFSLAGYYTPISSFYIGAALDLSSSWAPEGFREPGSSSTEKEETPPATRLFGIFPLVGYTFPIRFENSVIKPFADLRFALADNLISVLNVGVQWTPNSTSSFAIDMFLSLSIQMSGLNAGLWGVTVGIDLLDFIVQMNN